MNCVSRTYSRLASRHKTLCSVQNPQLVANQTLRRQVAKKVREGIGREILSGFSNFYYLVARARQIRKKIIQNHADNLICVSRVLWK